MARKFNIGRQGEQLLNDEWHQLFMSLKYLNYNRYKTIETPYPERQTDIPERALRFHEQKKVNLLETYYPNLGTGEWKPLFEGYYHPASAVKPDGDDFPAYQLCIDPESGAIMYWDPNNHSWIVARAAEYLGEASAFNGLNFQLINPLEQAKKIVGKDEVGNPIYVTYEYCPVPFVNYGRLFANLPDAVGKNSRVGRFAQPGNYIATNQCAISTDLKDLAWVHVNASKLVSIDKRLIRIEKDKKKLNYGFIDITSTQTEFYGFVSGNREGVLLLRDYDFTDVAGGIELIPDNRGNFPYDYVYCLTYIFDDYPSNEGYVLTDIGVVGENNQVYVGQSECPIALFMDGLALEQTDAGEEGVAVNEIYRYDEKEGVITFTDDDDAEIVRNMQMSILAFPKRTEEFILEKTADGITGPNVFIKEDSVSFVIGSGNNISNYKTPMVFCSGLGLQETEIFKDVTIEGNSVTIHGLVLPDDEPIICFVADVQDSFVCKGKLLNGKVYDESIKSDKDYAIFINGLLLTPTNGDMIISDGVIEVINALDAAHNVLDFALFEIENDNDRKIGLLFDDTVSYFSVRIDDHGKKAVYNDCNSAIVYVGTGIIIDEAAVERPINDAEGYFKGNQIIKAMDDYGNAKYFIYDYTKEEPEELAKDIADEVDHLLGYYSSPGSIHLLGDNDAWTNCSITYYAYSFANMIDEPMTHGRKTDLTIPVGKGNTTYEGQSSRFDVWNKDCAALSTYINGLMIENKEFDDDGDGVIRHYSIDYPKFSVPTDYSYYGEDVELIDLLRNLYNTYKDYTTIQIKTVDIDADYIEPINKEPISKYFASHSLFESAFYLGKYICEDMYNESTSYVIERIERDEFMSAYRDFINLETGKNNTDHTQLYGLANDTVITDFTLAPATVHVYWNGVLLENTEYCKFDNNKVMFNGNVCGLQQLPSLERKMECLPEHVPERDIYLDGGYFYKYQTKQVVRIIEDRPYYIPTSSRDTILIEKRNDTSIKMITYDVLSVSYSSGDFTQDFYDLPESLFITGDYIKIYINGVRYEGEYKIIRTGGIKGIKLMSSDALVIDPLYQHFLRYPDELENYKMTYNKEYTRQIDRITFEWR